MTFLQVDSKVGEIVRKNCKYLVFRLNLQHIGIHTLIYIYDMYPQNMTKTYLYMNFIVLNIVAYGLMMSE